MKLSNFFKLRYVILIIITTLVGFNCAHKKAYKKALEFEKAGRYVAAAEKDLEALDKKSDYTDAQVHLNQIAPRAYQELLSKGESEERNNQWADAIATWKHMDRLISRFRQRNIILQTINIRSRLDQAENIGRDYYYINAQKYFTSKNYVSAVDYYKKVYAIAGDYQGTKNRIWTSYIQLGNNELQLRQYSTAVQYYESSKPYATDINKTNQLIAEAHYQWASSYESEGKYREATESFETVLQIIPNYRDASVRRDQVYEKALRRIAIMPFDNGTRYGNQYCNLLTEELINNCINANLKYAVFMTRSNLDQIMEEYKLAMSGVVDVSKASEIGKLEGIHYFITGNITQISDQKTRPSFAEKTYDKSYTEKDTAGNDITKTRTIHYREYKSQRNVQISASYQIVEVETGRYTGGDNFKENIIDEANWVRYQGSIYDLPKDKQNLVDGETEPKSADILINDGMRSIAKKISVQILDKFK
jgi:tetratricopeptide (TPR) repeat protein